MGDHRDPYRLKSDGAPTPTVSAPRQTPNPTRSWLAVLWSWRLVLACMILAGFAAWGWIRALHLQNRITNLQNNAGEHGKNVEDASEDIKRQRDDFADKLTVAKKELENITRKLDAAVGQAEKAASAEKSATARAEDAEKNLKLATSRADALDATVKACEKKRDDCAKQLNEAQAELETRKKPPTDPIPKDEPAPK